MNDDNIQREYENKMKDDKINVLFLLIIKINTMTKVEKKR